MSETPAPAPLEPLREDWERVLCVVAHPDDMEFGAAAAVARWTGQGKWVVYCMVTSGEAGIDGMEPDECRRVREAEEIESARIVGVDDVEFLGQPDGVLEYGVPLRRAIAARRAPAPARHRDHRQLPRHLGRAQPQPGRPHRGRPRRASTRCATPATAGSSTTSSPTGSSRGAACRRCGRSAPRRPATASTPPTPSTRASTSLEAHAAYIDGLGWENLDAREFLEGMGRATGQRLGVAFAAPFEVFPMGWGD